METGNARDGRPQPAIHYRDRVDRWQGDRPTISALAIYQSGDLEIFGERESDAQCRANLALSRGGCEHRAGDVERRPHFDQACRLPAWQRETPSLRCRAGAEIFASRRAGAGTGSFRKNFGPGLVARPAKWCASSDEIDENAVNENRLPDAQSRDPVVQSSR